jgi:serine/threonine-protein kinase
MGPSTADRRFAERTYEHEILLRQPRIDVTVGAARPSEASPEFSLGLAGSVVQSRYRVNAVSSVHRDVVIYSAEDIRHGRSIALKVLRDDVARDSKFADAVRSQANALAEAGHVLRGVQRVHECGVTDTGQLFVALEWVEGATLRDVLDAGGALDVPTALRIAVRVGEALEALHHNRLVHGQLGPESVIMVTDGERIRLVGTELTAAYRTPLGLRLRDEFSLAYRAPEQSEPGDTTAASDVYALGMLLQQLLTASRAGQTKSPHGASPPLSPAIQRIIATALEARPVHRYPDISVMINDIWGATAVLAEPESRPRSIKARGNPRRRVRRRRPRFTLRITAAVATAGVVAAFVWVAGFDGLDRIVARFQSRVTPPAVTAVPVERELAPPAVTTVPTERDVSPPAVTAVPVEKEVRPGPEQAPLAVTREPTPPIPESRAAREPRPIADESIAPLVPRKPAPPSESRAVPDRSTPERPAPREPRSITDESTAPLVPRKPAPPSEPRTAPNRATPERPAPAGKSPAEPAVARQAPTAPSAVVNRLRPAVESKLPAESSAPTQPSNRSEPRMSTERPAPTERGGTEANDGSAVIDWLFKDRR